MATAFASTAARQPGNTLLHHVGTLAASFRWALEVQRRCDREAAAGRRLDGDTIRRIVAEADAGLMRR